MWRFLKKSHTSVVFYVGDIIELNKDKDISKYISRYKIHLTCRFIRLT